MVSSKLYLAAAFLVVPNLVLGVNFTHTIAPQGAKVLTVGVIGDYGWTGWVPSPDKFCLDVLPALQAANISVPNEVVNDCDPGDKEYITNATALQSMYQCLGNHDIVPGQSGVDFQTQVAPLYDSRWYFGTEGLPYYTYDLVGEDWTATFVVVDSDCFLDSYQKATSVYKNPYTTACHNDTSTQVNFLASTFAASNATWKFLQLHHPYASASTNQTDLAPLIAVVEQHKGIVMNGHDHCLGHFFLNNTNFILSGAAGYPQAGDCNNGIAPGPYALYLAANNLTAANGFVTMDISSESVNVEYYARDMYYEGSDLYPVECDLLPSYNFTITQKST